MLADFAELVFAYIDELSAAAVAGHTDETETTGRVRQRLLERVAALLLDGAPAEEVTEAAERAGWDAAHHADRGAGPRVAGAPGARPGLAAAPSRPPRRRGSTRARCCWSPTRTPTGVRRCCGPSRDRGSIAGPAVPWLDVRRSVDRALRARELGIELDTEAELPRLVLHADESALADLRARVLAPLEGLRPSTAEKLADTLRAWLLHQGRRDDIAAALFVHPQTVRYRMGQLRDLYGDRLEDPDTVLALTIALA